MSSSNLYSHPERLLEDHLIGVAKCSELFLSEKPIEIKKQLNDVCKLIALSHDIGKATDYFQKYLFSDEKEKVRLKNLPQTKHSLLSAVCAYYLCRELTTENKFLPFFAFLTVRRHHGNLIDISDEVTWDTKYVRILHSQVENIDGNKFSILAQRLHDADVPMRLSKDIIKSWVDNFGKELKSIKKHIRGLNNGVFNFITLNLLYSLLLDADKSNVVIKDISVFERRESISGNLVDNYKAKNTFADSPINYLREKAYIEIAHSNINPGEKIYSINLPTGLGKTLTSLSFALKLREKIGLNNRIIYALPFLSIIDQNSEIFELVIKANHIEPNTSILLKHHHLSEIFYKKEDNEFEPDEAKILIEGWNSEIIVTTFVQLFHTLISNKKRSIRKFHRLANSIIMLDEVQSIPVKYWLLLRTILAAVSKMLNSYIIFVTATEPLIFERENIIGLLNRNYYFNILNRFSIKPLLDKPMKINDLSDFFNLDDSRTYLFILNTIASARTLYSLIKKKGFSTTYLSTHITPKERLERIRGISEKKYRIVVATQLVEAGVDIDFDVVIRDMAPLDSIIQAIGRCNRNGKKKGEGYIIFLEDHNRRPYSSYIYDPVLIDITQKILRDRKEIKESELLPLIDGYYIETKKKKTQQTSRGILEAITKLRYDNEDDRASITDFKLIEEDYPKRDVFIELDEEAKLIWQQYLALRDVKDLVEKKNIFDSLKAEFYQYVISIPSNIKNIPQMFGEIGYVEHAILKDYYDSETGFIIRDTSSEVIW